MSLSNAPGEASQALYYPFHLCHERTLARLLEEYASIHFRDYMALQVTPLSGTTAHPDRMGDAHPELLKSGRLVQGYPVSGPPDPDLVAAMDRDLADSDWRARFHRALIEDRRFQRGLFDLTHGMRIGAAMVPGPAALLRFLEEPRRDRPCSFERLRQLSGRPLTPEEGYDYEYALALVKTAAALAWTIRLCLTYGLVAVTDSRPHYDLLERSLDRDRIVLPNRWIAREGY
ncbi:hypothetical protein [Nitrospira sp. Kam-Ns4a]